MLLHFLHAITNDRDRVHVLLFGTRLTNITRALRHRDVDVALARVASAVADWAGGTRIGTCVAEFNRRWSRRLLGQNAVVLLISDGLDAEGGSALSAEMERLHKSCRRLVWLNPLLRYEGFEARPAGIKAMLPHVDDFLPVHNLASLTALAAALDRPQRARPRVGAAAAAGLTEATDGTLQHANRSAPVDTVWAALNDPEMLRGCVPGCDAIEPDGENAYRITMAAKVGPVSAKFAGRMRLSDIDPPRGYTLSFEGQGGAAGFAKGEAKVTLAPEANGAATALSYAVKAQVGGKIAQLGSRLVDGAAQKLADDFFGRFSDAVAAKAGVPPVPRPQRAGDAALANACSSRSSSRISSSGCGGSGESRCGVRAASVRTCGSP